MILRDARLENGLSITNRSMLLPHVPYTRCRECSSLFYILLKSVKCPESEFVGSPHTALSCATIPNVIKHEVVEHRLPRICGYTLPGQAYLRQNPGA